MPMDSCSSHVKFGLNDQPLSGLHPPCSVSSIHHQTGGIMSPRPTCAGRGRTVGPTFRPPGIVPSPGMIFGPKRGGFRVKRGRNCSKLLKIAYSWTKCKKI